MEESYFYLPNEQQRTANNSPSLSRSSFPPGFVFGAATSAYQIEGAVTEDGRGLSIWDSFTHVKGKRNISDGSTADIACNSYNLYEDDIKLMVDLGIDAYRFSFSWSRIFSDDINRLNCKGVSHYNQLINKLIKNGIQPYVTLYHWDLPQVLENDPEVKGWRTEGIVDHYVRYAETCFKMFGDRVKNWITFNEIQRSSTQGYGTGLYAPGRCNNRTTEPYVVVHNMLLAHAAAVTIYRKRYQEEQGGRIGISSNAEWYEPWSQDETDVKAVQRCLEFELGWVLDPVMRGHYPDFLRGQAGNRLPSFTAKESLELQGSVDFIGINYYTTLYAKSASKTDNPLAWDAADRLATTTGNGPDGKPIGETMGPPAITWIHNCPWGLPKLIGWIKDRYAKDDFKNLPILITENGPCDDNTDLPITEALNDHKRIKYISDTLQHLANSIKEQHYNVEAYFAWSLMDNFEWNLGFSCRFGLYYVDFKNNQRRYPKSSAFWYKKFLQTDSIKHPFRVDNSTYSHIHPSSTTFLGFLLSFFRIPLYACYS